LVNKFLTKFGGGGTPEANPAFAGCYGARNESEAGIPCLPAGRFAPNPSMRELNKILLHDIVKAEGKQ